MFRSVRDTVLRFGVVGPVALFTGLGPLVGAIVLTATGPLWLDRFLGAGAVRIPVFLGLTAVLAGYSLIPTHASSLLAGMGFGIGLGTAMALVGTGLAAALGFTTLRFFLREKAVEALAHHPRVEAVHRELDQGHALRTIGLLALIRLSPVVPFAATNLLMATTGVRLAPFLVGSLLGQAPRIIAVVWIGSSLTELDLSQAADRRLLALGVVATAATLWVLGRLSRRGLTGTYPLQASSFEALAELHAGLPAIKMSSLSRQWRTLLADLLNRKPEHRPTAGQLEASPFLET